jgi:hypothetical protein
MEKQAKGEFGCDAFMVKLFDQIFSQIKAIGGSTQSRVLFVRQSHSRYGFGLYCIGAITVVQC